MNSSVKSAVSRAASGSLRSVAVAFTVSVFSFSWTLISTRGTAISWSVRLMICPVTSIIGLPSATVQR